MEFNRQFKGNIDETADVHVNAEDEDIDDGDEDNDEDDETYLKFLKSVLVDDDQFSFASNSCNDDDEEDFVPEDESDDQSHDADDEDDEKDGEENTLVKIAKRELQDLIDGCWQTLAAEAGCKIVEICSICLLKRICIL